MCVLVSGMFKYFIWTRRKSEKKLELTPGRTTVADHTGFPNWQVCDFPILLYLNGPPGSQHGRVIP